MSSDQPLTAIQGNANGSLETESRLNPREPESDVAVDNTPVTLATSINATQKHSQILASSVESLQGYGLHMIRVSLHR